MKVVKDEIVVTVYSCIPEGEVPMEAWPQSPSELTLPFFGADARRFSGAYGTRGRELCGHLATQWATKRRMRCFPLDVALTIDGAHSTRAMITRSHLDAGHSWLHFERIASALREEIKEKFIHWVDQRDGSKARACAAPLRLEQISLQHPELVNVLLDDEPCLSHVAHPVRTSYSPDRPLYAMTSKLPLAQCGAWAKVRFRDDSLDLG